MIWKVFTFFGLALLAFSEARPPISEQKVKIETHEKLSHIGPHKPEHHEAYAWAYPSYEFKYEVDDPHTHDFKGHEETRKGDEVKGHYWLIQPDGYKRTVKYHVDKKSGFKAHVDYTKLHHKLSEENAGEEENSNEGGESNDNSEDGSNENINKEEAHVPNKHEFSSDNEGESANLDDNSEHESYQGHGTDRDTWRRGDIKFWGRRRGHDESHKNHKNNNEEDEQESTGSDNVSNREEQASEENESIHHGKVEEHSSGTDSGNEGSSAVENKSEKRVIKHEYHVIIHHPIYIPTSHKKHGK